MIKIRLHWETMLYLSDWQNFMCGGIGTFGGNVNDKTYGREFDTVFQNYISILPFDQQSHF